MLVLFALFFAVDPGAGVDALALLGAMRVLQLIGSRDLLVSANVYGLTR
jgi:hypothetical protein